MAPREKSAHKRGRLSVDADSQDLKKPRRSQRISSQHQPQETPVDHDYLPTPLTHSHSTATDIRNEVTATPPESPSRTRAPSSPNPDLSQVVSSPPGDTQALSQFVYPPRAFADEVEDEDAEGVWGYLIPLDDKVSSAFTLKKRDGCDNREDAAKDKSGKNSQACKQKNGRAPGGYLIGRHPECDLVINSPTISNRHFLVFEEKRKGDVVAILEDLSSNGTFVNEAMVGRNKHRELEDGDEVSILNEARFSFRYPRSRDTNGFRQQYRTHRQLGKGHFATVYLCVEGSTGKQYAVKVFEKRPGDSQKSQSDALQQEVALLKSVNHPNLLCLKDTFDETDGAYLVLELAPEGELFNLILSKKKLSESETRHLFRQLFEGLKYLHDRGIVHRDIKPENILLADKKMTVKLGDFGLAKIIGEDSFTTTLCGTPCYVAPEILEDTRRRRYTKAVDVWSLGVVLYICLCGFPPFSDELYTRNNPLTLAQQIKSGKFDYPAPWWDSVGDPALDLIDRMLTVDVEKRITVDDCLEHPWMTEKYPNVTDSTDGLTGALGNLDFSKRKMERERTLLSSVNDVLFSEHVEGSEAPIKVFHNNNAGTRIHNQPAKVESSPGDQGSPKGFVNLGERGDPALYDEPKVNRHK
ncbi:serine/threonine-protein kinase chk2 (cds1) [Penicillium verhagenii]|uniref:serine/threonine-protein kinase chk2 (cds1) n=1 Tax=Penicillium verhagenii TaxID=1562060 RepID=UPI002544E1DA|nr:serine/threonine-protein kinase chk2 (cds1) [Penicillium verhagenii]KAJ5919026.1 serine/threonine-protein kinase chk2 (cds1) [Penicillium verhagenii]